MGAYSGAFGSLLVHTPHAEARWPLGWTFSTFDYRQLCELLWEQRGASAEFETPVSLGVLTCDTTAQAQARAGGDHGNKGWDAAMAALERVDLLDRLDAADSA